MAKDDTKTPESAVLTPDGLVAALTAALNPTPPAEVWVVSTHDREKGLVVPVRVFADRAKGEQFAEGLGCPAETRRVEMTP